MPPSAPAPSTRSSAPRVAGRWRLAQSIGLRSPGPHAPDLERKARNESPRGPPPRARVAPAQIPRHGFTSLRRTHQPRGARVLCLSVQLDHPRDNRGAARSSYEPRGRWAEVGCAGVRGGLGIIVGPIVGGAIAGLIVLVLVPALPAHRHPDPGGYPVECNASRRCYQLNKRVRKPTAPAEQRRCRRFGSQGSNSSAVPASSYVWHPLRTNSMQRASARTFICAPPAVVLPAPVSAR